MQKSIVNIGNRCHFHILRLFMWTFFSLLNFLSHKAKKKGKQPSNDVKDQL